MLPWHVHLYVGHPLGQHTWCNFSIVSISPAAGPFPLPCHCQIFPSINVPTELPPYITCMQAASCHREAACDCRDVLFDGSLGKGLMEGWKNENEAEILAAVTLTALQSWRERSYSSAVRKGRAEVMGEVLLASGCDCSPLKGGSHEVMGLRRRDGGFNDALEACLISLIWESRRRWNFRIDEFKVSAFYTCSINPINVYFTYWSLSQAAAWAQGFLSRKNLIHFFREASKMQKPVC